MRKTAKKKKKKRKKKKNEEEKEEEEEALHMRRMLVREPTSHGQPALPSTLLGFFSFDLAKIIWRIFSIILLAHTYIILSNSGK